MKVLIFGSGAHASAVTGVIEEEGQFEIVGMVDSFAKAGSMAFGYKVLGSESALDELVQEHGTTRFFVAIGDNYHRQRISQLIKTQIKDAQFVSAVHPTAVIAKNAVLGPGTIVMPGAIVMSGSKVGAGCILNTRSTLEHDGELADWSSLAPSVTTGGKFKMGARSAIGLGVIIKHGISVGHDSVVGAGALVLEDVPPLVTAYGQPCRVIRTRTKGEGYL